MPKINSTEFGSITVDNVVYNQVLIIGSKVVEREYEKLKSLFGTSHRIGEWELDSLLKEDPEIIIIGTGQDGMLMVDVKVIDTINEKNIELVIEKTPKAIDIYNQEIAKGKKVNAIIHTTC